MTDDVEPFSTTTVATISGGGSLGGLEFDAAVTDVNGNPVTKGTVSLVIGTKRKDGVGRLTLPHIQCRKSVDYDTPKVYHDPYATCPGRFCNHVR